jgi:protein involved in polysaccharide export with SLBB domain
MRRLLPAIALVLSSCAAPEFPVAKMVQEWAEYMNRDHKLEPGDLVEITAFQQPELTQEILISSEGSVSLRRLEKPVRAVGRPVAEFRDEVQRAYAELIPNVEVSVNLKTPRLQSVYVGGEVKTPSAVPWHGDLTIVQAIAAAGSFDITAKSSDVLLVRPEKGREPRMIRVNTNAIIDGLVPDFPLLPGDVVWVQTSGIADVGNWVELYIRRLLPIYPGVAIPL